MKQESVPGVLWLKIVKAISFYYDFFHFMLYFGVFLLYLQSQTNV